MKIDQEFYVNSWLAKSPDFVLKALRAQLEAATAIWPELDQVKIAKRRVRASAVASAQVKGDGQ